MRRPASDLNALQTKLNSAIAKHKAGDVDAAEELYKQVLDKAPSQPDALNLLGVIQAEKNRNDLAVELIAKAVRLRPKEPIYLNNLGRACVRGRRFSEALDPLEKAIALDPTIVEAYGNLIQAHRALGHFDETRYFIDQLRHVKGGSITADIEEARLWSDWGKREKAHALLASLLEREPDHALAWHALARLEKASDRSILSGVLEALERAPEPSVSRKFLLYAAGKLSDDLGEYAQAFDFFASAKQQDPPTYDEQKTRRHFETIKATFTEDFFRTRGDFGIESSRPIFIVGMPRSGTTLAEQVLSSHPDVGDGGELEFIGQITGSLTEYARSGRYPDAARKLNQPTIASLAFKYERLTRTIDSEAVFFTDKMPHNFLSLGLIHLMFPNARIVHCTRHPYDTCLSCYMHDFAHTHGYNSSLETLARYYNLYRDLMAHWSKLFGHRIFDLNYDEYISDPTEVSRNLFEFLGLSWDEKVNSVEMNTRRVSTPSSWQVRQPLYKTSSGRWQLYRDRILPGLEQINEKWIS